MKKGLRKVISLFCAVSMMLSCVPFRAVSDGDTGFEQEDILLPELTETPDPEPVEETAFTPSAEPDGETSGETAPEALAEEAAAAQEVTAEAGQEDPGEENPETPPASAQEAPAEETPDTPGEPAAEEQALAQDVPVETPAEAGQEDPAEEPPETPAAPAQETPAETTTDTSGDPAEEGQEPVQDAPGIPAEDTQPENGEEDPETPEETGTDENREDRRIDLSREPERTEWITDGMLEEEKEFVIRITAGKETDLFFLLESNAGLDAVLTDEGHGHSKDFTKEHREADDGNTEGIPMVRYTLEAVHVEQGGSRLIRITGIKAQLRIKVFHRFSDGSKVGS